MPKPLSKEEIVEITKEQISVMIETALRDENLLGLFDRYRQDHNVARPGDLRKRIIKLEEPEIVTRDTWVPFNAIRAPGTKPATFKEWGISGVWEFSDATDDTIVANIQFPYDMDKSITPTIIIGWSTNTAVVTETAVWQLEYLYIKSSEDTTLAAQGTLTVNSNAAPVADGMVLATFPTLIAPDLDDLCIHIRIKRLGADGSDDLTDTAELHGLCMSYTSDKRGI